MGGRRGGHLLGGLPPSLPAPTKSLIFNSYIISMITLNTLTCNELCVFVLDLELPTGRALSLFSLGFPTKSIYQMNGHMKKNPTTDSPAQKDPYPVGGPSSQSRACGPWRLEGSNQTNPGLGRESESVNDALRLPGLPVDLGASVPV